MTTTVRTAVFTFVLLGFAAVAAAQRPAEVLVPSVTVVGTSEVKGEPDMAEINVGVVTEAESAAEAVQQNNKAMERLFDALHARDIAKKDIQTASFNIMPQRRQMRSNEPQEIAGYRVINQVRIKVRRIKDLGAILDEVVEQGANQIDGINFSISDPRELLDEARRKAVEDARRKAKLYAEAAGVELGKVLLMEEASAQPPRPFMRGVQVRAAGERAVPISPGEKTLSAQVTVTYALAGRE